MSRLSSPDSVLKKISEIHARIDELDETVTAVREFRRLFEEVWRDAREREEILREKVGRFEDLEADCAEAIRRLSALGSQAEAELARWGAEFGWERERVNDALSGFAAERAGLDDHRRDLDQRFTEAIRELKELTGYTDERVGVALENHRLEVSRVLDETLRRLDKKLESLTLAAEMDREEFFALEDRLEDFKIRLDLRLKHSLANLVEKQRLFSESAIHDLHARFDGEAESTRKRTSAVIDSMESRFEEGKLRLEYALAFLEDEKNAAAARADRNISELARIRRDVDDLMETARTQIAQEVGRVTTFVSGAEKDVRDLRAVVKQFKDRTREYLEGEFASLTRRQTEFQEKSGNEISARLAEEVNLLREASEREIRTLRGERNNIDDMHRVLEEAVSQVHQTVQDKAAFFTTQLDNLVVGTRKELEQASEAALSRVDGELARHMEAATAGRQEMELLRASLQAAVSQMLGRVETLMTDTRNRQSEFQQRMEADIEGKFSGEAQRLLEAARQDAEAGTAEVRNQTSERQNQLVAQFNTFIERNRARMTRVEETAAEALGRTERESVLTKERIKKLFEHQKAIHSNALPALERRVAELERILASRDGQGSPSAPKKKRDSALPAPVRAATSKERPDVAIPPESGPLAAVDSLPENRPDGDTE